MHGLDWMRKGEAGQERVAVGMELSALSLVDKHEAQLAPYLSPVTSFLQC